MKVLVTGGAGYIGSHTVRELVNRGHEAIVLDTLESGRRELAERAGASRLIVGSTSDRSLLDSIFAEEQPQAVMHFAAYKAAGESVAQPAKYFANNIVNTLQLLGAMLCHDVKLFIFSSSCSIFGTPSITPVAEDNNPTSPESPYGESKLMVEKILGWYDRAYALRSVSLRYFNAAGASLDGQLGEDWSASQNLVPLVMKAALGYAQSVQVLGTDYPTPDGTCIRDYVHVADLAEAHVLALEYLVESNISTAYNLGTQRGSSVKEVIDTIRRISNSDFRVEYAGRRPGDPPAIWADSSRAQRELGWHPRHDLDTILRTAYEWHKAHPDGY
ncbi:MAG TPA: UDP-glucose 4-epimerase GalE [Chloroflexia bacterium]|nr:UDP-glucose 4-epimerase GalE [Chloroflexia bacterium]